MADGARRDPEQKPLSKEDRVRLEAFLLALSDTNPELRARATSFVLLLGKKGNPETLNCLVNGLRDARCRDDVQRLIIQICSEGPEDATLVKRCSAVLHDKDAKAREAAAQIMTTLATPFSFYCLIKTLETGSSDVQTAIAWTLMDFINENNRIIAKEGPDDKTNEASKRLHRLGYELAKSLARVQKLELKKSLLLAINNSSIVDGCIPVFRSSNVLGRQTAEDVLVECAAMARHTIARCIDFLSDRTVANRLETVLLKMDRDQVLRICIGRLVSLDMPTQKKVVEIILRFAHESDEQAASIVRYSAKALSGSHGSNHLRHILLSLDARAAVQELVVTIDEETVNRIFIGCRAILSKLALEKPEIVREVFEELARGKIVRERKYDFTLKKLSRDVNTPYGKIAFAIMESLEVERGSKYRRWVASFHSLKHSIVGKMPDFLKRKRVT